MSNWVRPGTGEPFDLTSEGSVVGALADDVSSSASPLRSEKRGIMRGGIELMDDGERPGVDGFGSYRLSRSIFQSGISACFLVAFSSLLVQIPGLMGSDGILPAWSFISRTKAITLAGSFGTEPWVVDVALDILCLSGMALSAWGAAGNSSALSILACWVLYASLVVAGQEFTHYEWDQLLLEAGLVAAALAPSVLPSQPQSAPPPSGIALLLSRMLLFKFMVMSGTEKVSSGGEAWRSLTAVGQAMGTQPLPTPAGWYIALLPSWLLKILAGAIIVVEVPISFLVLSPLRGIRHAAAVSHLCVQAFVAISGGYGFYPILASVLAVPCFDDAAWAWLLRISDAGNARERETKPLIGLPTKATGAYGTSDDSKGEANPEQRLSARHQPLIGGAAARWFETVNRNASLQAALTSGVMAFVGLFSLFIMFKVTGEGRLAFTHSQLSAVLHVLMPLVFSLCILAMVLFAVNEFAFCARSPRVSTGLALLPQVALTCALATMVTSSNWRLLVPTGELNSLAKSHLALLSTGREPAEYAAGKYVGAPGIRPGQTRHPGRITDPSPPPLHLQYPRTGLENWDAKLLVGSYGAELAAWGGRGAGKDFVIWATDPAQDCASESESWKRVPFMFTGGGPFAPPAWAFAHMPRVDYGLRQVESWADAGWVSPMLEHIMGGSASVASILGPGEGQGGGHGCMRLSVESRRAVAGRGKRWWSIEGAGSGDEVGRIPDSDGDAAEIDFITPPMTVQDLRCSPRPACLSTPTTRGGLEGGGGGRRLLGDDGTQTKGGDNDNEEGDGNADPDGMPPTPVHYGDPPPLDQLRKGDGGFGDVNSPPQVNAETLKPGDRVRGIEGNYHWEANDPDDAPPPAPEHFGAPPPLYEIRQGGGGLGDVNGAGVEPTPVSQSEGRGEEDAGGGGGDGDGDDDNDDDDDDDDDGLSKGLAALTNLTASIKEGALGRGDYPDFVKKLGESAKAKSGRTGQKVRGKIVRVAEKSNGGVDNGDNPDDKDDNAGFERRVEEYTNKEMKSFSTGKRGVGKQEPDGGGGPRGGEGGEGRRGGSSRGRSVVADLRSKKMKAAVRKIKEQQARAAEFAKENASRQRNGEEDSGGLYGGWEASLRRTAHGLRQVRRGRHNKEQAGGMQWLSPTQNRAVERDLAWAEGKAAPVTSIVERRADKAIDGFSDLWAGMGTGIVPLPFRVPVVALVWAILAILILGDLTAWVDWDLVHSRFMAGAGRGLIKPAFFIIVCSGAAVLSGPVFHFYFGSCLAIAIAGGTLGHYILHIDSTTNEGSWGEGVRKSCDITDDVSASRAARSQESCLFGMKHAAIGVAVYFAVVGLALGAALTGLYWLLLAILFIASWWSLTSIYLIHLQLSVAKVVCPLTAGASVVSMLLLSMTIAWCSQVRWATYNVYV